MADDEFGGFEEFDDDPFGDDTEGGEVDAAEDFGSAFAGEGDGGDFDGFGEEDFEEFADAGSSAGDSVDNAIAEDEEYDDEDTASSARPAASASAPKAAPKAAPDAAGGAGKLPLNGGATPRTGDPAAGGARNAETFTNSQAVAVKMNKSCIRLTQPFVAGYDMTTDQQLKINGRGLRRLLINGAMTAPGSFGAEIRTGPGGTGELLAKDSRVRTSSAFTKTILDFAEDQPVLTEGKVYHLHVILEQGAFKFQGALIKSIKTVGKDKLVHPFSAKKEDTWAVSNSSLVLKPILQKVVPRIGDKSGFLLVKRVQRGSRGRRTSLRRTAKEGMRKFIVVEGKLIKMYAKTDGPVEREIDLGTVEYIESKGGSMETKDFNIVTKSEELQFAAPSSSECQKWLKVIEKGQKSASREFGSAASTNMLF